MPKRDEVDPTTYMYAVAGALAQVDYGTDLAEMRESLEELRAAGGPPDLTAALEAKIARTAVVKDVLGRALARSRKRTSRKR